jgi:hypothetical protein
MKLQNDELIIWKDQCNMILAGEIVKGELVITNRRLYFQEGKNPHSFKVWRDKSDLWDLDIWKVKDAALMEFQGIDYPMIRLRYSEHEVFFTFPDYDPRQSLAGIIVFINHARMIEKLMDLMRNVERNLKSGNLNVGEEMPKLRVETPTKADEECYQCGKTLLEEDIDEIAQEVKECMNCIPEMH